MFNAIGTLLRASTIMFTFLFAWFIIITTLFYLGSIIVGIEFSLKTALIIFIFIMLFRSFYPRNIFK